MKNLLLLTALSLFPIFGYATTETELLRCIHAGSLLGAPSYSFTVERFDEGPAKYYLKKIPLNPTVQPWVVEMPRPLIYGDTLISTKDQGRSGYAHLYARGKTSVIDINFFQEHESGINTDGAEAGYNCERAN